MRTAIFIFLFALTHSLTSLYVKIGLNNFGEITMEQLKRPLSLLLALASNPFILAGWILVLVSPILYYLIISRVKLSYAFLAPRSLAYILVILFSWVFLKEIITIKWRSKPIMIFLSTFMLCQERSHVNIYINKYISFY